MTPAEILEQLLRLRQSTLAAASEFRSLKHDADLCPKFTSHVDTILESYVKYNHIVYNTQSPRDHGIDVLLKSGPRGGEESFIAIQVKSFACIKRSDWSQSIKAQLTDARNYCGGQLERYYLMLCTDPVAHRKEVQFISSDLGKDPLVRVISPLFAHYFFSFTDTRLRAFVERVLRNDDCVHAHVATTASSLTPGQFAILLTCVASALDRPGMTIDPVEIRDADLVRSASIEFLPDYETICGEFLDLWASECGPRLRLDDTRSVQALYLDLIARYRYSMRECAEHVFALFSEDCMKVPT